MEVERSRWLSMWMKTPEAGLAKENVMGTAEEEEEHHQAAGHSRSERLHHALRHAAHYLPAQAPLEVFVHHNTLHAFQSLPFYDALTVAGRRLGARMFLPESAYRSALERGRISEVELRRVLASAPALLRPAHWPERLPSPEVLAFLIMRHGLHETTAAGLGWLLSETEAMHKLRDDLPDAARKRLLSVPNADSVSVRPASEAAMTEALWQACAELAQQVTPPQPAQAAPLFFRDPLWQLSGEDPCELVHQTLIPLAAAFLDRGEAQWPMPDRMQGFYLVWEDIMTAGLVVRPAWSRQLGRRIRAHRREGYDSEHEVLDLLDELGILDDELEEYVTQTLLYLPGWAGMFARLEQNSDPIMADRAKVRLIDFLAVRLELDELAFTDIAQRLGYEGPLRGLRDWLRSQINKQQAGFAHGPLSWALFQLMQLSGQRPQDLWQLSATEAQALGDWVVRFSESVRLPLWHDAYELHYRDELLLGLWANRVAQREASALPAQHPPTLQLLCCMDDREESLRRHFEVLCPDSETFGTAGFFNLAIAYQGIDDPSTFPLCPVVVTPHHKIVEEPDEEHVESYARRQRRQARWSRLTGLYKEASRSLLVGSLVTAASGLWSAVPLLLTIFAPGLAAKLRQRVSKRLIPEVRTHLSVRGEGSSGIDAKLQTGFSIPEKADRVATLLQNIGLVRGFAKLVIILGHTSHSVNNPHFAAYACGACGGRSGGPNARLFARMANRKEVRALLRTRGIDIPDGTRFVGGEHDTCDDTVRLFDEEEVPSALHAELLQAKVLLQRALLDNARERVRRFDAAPLGLGAVAAQAHVDERSADLSQARPELGHATNASAIIGRRTLSKGLFLDRRTFLISYDPTIDPDGAILERTLVAATPVGAGINLEYFFSTVDNQRLGAGTKLPHNVTGLFGVMNGASSDLRTGLPAQMIEIHEPVRLQLVIENRPAMLAAILERQPSVAELVVNHWVQVISLDPDTGDLAVFVPGRGFEPWTPASGRGWESVPTTESWHAYYAGQRSFLPPARLVAQPDEDTRPSARRERGEQ